MRVANCWTSGRPRLAKTGAGVCLAGAIALLTPAAAAASSTQGSFTDTGTEQTFTVPSGVTSLQVMAVGAPGGNGQSGGVGGLGGVVSATISVSAGETLYVEVGGAGASGGPGSGTVEPPTFNGGGGAVQAGGAGGGASDVRTIPMASADSLSSRLIIAGGGGGGGNDAAGGGAGGNAGSPAGIAGGTGSAGGGGGTQIAGGSGGTGSQGGGNGTGGVPGVGGSGPGPNFGGGGGGGGLYGGGGGGGMGQCNPCDAAGGGGGGSSLVPTGGTSAMATAGEAPEVQISWQGISVQPSSLTFSATPQGTLAVGQRITITNNASSADLVVSGFSFGGSAPTAGTDHPEDFLVESSTCYAPVAPDGSCQVVVGFAPQGTGTRTATLQIVSNAPGSPTSVALSGIGGSLPQGPTGPTGATGPGGPKGATGPKGPDGRVELITCRTVKAKSGGKVHERQKCTGKLVAGPVKFTIAGASDRAAISRGDVVYATGVSVRMGRGRTQLLLTDLRPLRAGRYTLTLRDRHGKRWISRRTEILLR